MATFISYAQNFEDVMLWRALRHVEKGFYIDVGAQDPIVDSVSLSFYEKGWRGIHVEPTPHYASLLRQKRIDDQVLQAAVSKKIGVMRFFEIPNTGISTGSKKIADEHQERGFPILEITVATVTLANIFELVDAPEVHWLKIDVEGMEGDVLRSWGSSKLRPWIVVIESTLPLTQIQSHAAWEDAIVKLGYQAAHFDGLNRYYVSKKHLELMPAFEFGPNVFDDFAFNGTGSAPFCSLLNHKHANALEEIRNELNTVRDTSADDLRRANAEHYASIQSALDEKKALLAKATQLETQLTAMIEQRALLESKSLSAAEVLNEARAQASASQEKFADMLASEQQKLAVTNAELQSRLVQLARLEAQLNAGHEALAQQRARDQVDQQQHAAELSKLNEQLADMRSALETARHDTQIQYQILLEREQTHNEKLKTVYGAWRQAEAELSARQMQTHQHALDQIRQQHVVEIREIKTELADVRSSLADAQREAQIQHQTLLERERIHIEKLEVARESWRQAEVEQAAHYARAHQRALDQAREQHAAEVVMIEAQLTGLRSELKEARHETQAQHKTRHERERTHAEQLEVLHVSWRQSEVEQATRLAQAHQYALHQTHQRHACEVETIEAQLVHVHLALEEARRQAETLQSTMIERERSHAEKLEVLHDSWRQADTQHVAYFQRWAESVVEEITAVRASRWWRLGTFFGWLPNIGLWNRSDLLMVRPQLTESNNQLAGNSAWSGGRIAAATAPAPTLCDVPQESNLYGEAESEMDMIDQLLLSPEREFLARAYQLILGREPDTGGMANYLTWLRVGKSRIEVLAVLLASEEALEAKRPDLEELRELINQTGAGLKGWRKWLATPKLIHHRLRLIECQMRFLAASVKMQPVITQYDLPAIADTLSRIESLLTQSSHVLVSDRPTQLAQPLPLEESRVEELAVGGIKIMDDDLHFRIGEKRTLEVRLENCSNVVWMTNVEMSLYICYHWLFENGDMCHYDGYRTSFSEPVAPGESRILQANVLPPKEPGDYVLEVTLLLEGQYWFEARGFKTCRKPVSVVFPELSPHAVRIYEDLKHAIANSRQQGG